MHLSSGFGESVGPTDAISSILGTYPFSIGLLREVEQNSDDAGADVQVFLLDHRSHSKNGLLHDGLAGAQGPALLAYNNATFSDDDWDALQRIHRSSKKSDTSKIGKYGIGFRSCYHITDTPQIISGTSLAVLDPHHNFSSDGGIKIDLTNNSGRYEGHLEAFNLKTLVPRYSLGTPLHGTIIRLPLRQDGAASRISSKTLTAAEIRKLLCEFCQEELQMSMLFLKNLTSIDILEITDEGLNRLGKATVTKTAIPQRVTNYTQQRVTVNTGESSQEWHLVEAQFPPSDCVELLTERLGYDTSEILQKEKLIPNVAVAVPMPLSDWSEGRLFTYLPLPLPTGFPCHIHALFALTQARQNLWNGSEKGVVHGTRDELLVEWNNILFEEFIPRNWAACLETLTRGFLASPEAIFLAWPPTSQDVSGGDPRYWCHVGTDLLRLVVEKHIPIWPVAVLDFDCTTSFGGNEDTSAKFAPLDDVLVSSSSGDATYIPALARAGVNVTMPPERIVTMLQQQSSRDTDMVYNQLTPVSARNALLENMALVVVLKSNDKQKVLEYLLSEGDIGALVGVPVVPLINGDYVALECTAGTPPARTHALLSSEDEVKLFGRFDNDTVVLSHLPDSARPIFLSCDTGLVNVSLLSPVQVVHYLRSILGHLTSKKKRSWTISFWTWLAGWTEEERDEVFVQMGDMLVLPDSEGCLHSVSATLFQVDGIDSATQKVLSTLGVVFLDANISQSPHSVAFLKSKGVLGSVHDIHTLLMHLELHASRSLVLQELDTLRQHLDRCLIDCRKALNESQKRRLKAFPIFPIMPTSTPPEEPKYDALPTDLDVWIVDTSTSNILTQPGSDSATILLPNTTGFVFVAHSFRGLGSTRIVSSVSSAHAPVSELKIVQLFIDNVEEQSRPSLRAFLTCLVKNCQAIPPQTLTKLGKTPFLPVGAGDSAAPVDVVDPVHRIAAIVNPQGANYPRLVDPLDEAIVHSLRKLKLLRTTLGHDIIKECLYRVSSSGPGSVDLSTNLIRILNESEKGLKLYELRGELSCNWLPTSKGLSSPADCRDNSSLCPRALFDHILDVLQVDNFSLSSTSLREALGWADPLPLDVIKKQLNRELLEGATASRILTIVRELSNRIDELEQTDIVEKLKKLTATRQWIPTNSPGELGLTSRAILSPNSAGPIPPGFYQPHYSLMSDGRCLRLLSLMGCSERPLNASILEEVREFGTEVLSSNEIEDVLCLLASLDVPHLSDEDRSKVPVPDKEGVLFPVEEVYYNDLGTRAYKLELPDSRRDVHARVQQTNLVSRLGIQSLSSLNLRSLDLDDEDDEEDMHEDLTLRISNVLRQYSRDQAPNEFLANATDAGANRYDILLDTYRGGTENILAPSMDQFQTSPAFIVHNNAVFTKADFKGIRSVGLGGKQDRSDAIGKFGLGALSMFHFTEVSMIVSGDSVMFLDPSRKYLPANGHRLRRVVRVPLSHMWRQDSDHVRMLHGLYGFEFGMKYYNGTIFRLPLRSNAQAKDSQLSKEAVSVGAVIELLKRFGQVAPQSLIYIPVGHIGASQRDTDGNLTPLWSVEATRGDTLAKPPTSITQEEVKLAVKMGRWVRTESWVVVSSQTPLEALPEEFRSLTSKHKLRPISVALAGKLSPDNLSDAQKKLQAPGCRFYSKLPLPTLTSLPVHVDASFILADDRRTIRFDESGQTNLESKYNCWLLSHKIPALYLVFLEKWPQDDNLHLWPGNNQQNEDPISRMVIDSFYFKHFAASKQKICLSMSTQRLSPSKSVFLGTESKSVKKVLKCLSPASFVQLPKRIRMRVFKPEVHVRQMNARDIHNAILSASTVFLTSYKRGFSLEDIDVLLKRMLGDDHQSLLGLPVLPLASGELGTIRPASHPDPFFIAPVLWKPWDLFPVKRFVHSSISVQVDMLATKIFNIADFSETRAVSLIPTVFAPAILPGTTQMLDRSQQKWLLAFWGQISNSPIEPDSVASFPLVPTDDPGIYTSLSCCRIAGMFLRQSLAPGEGWLLVVLKALGATVVDIPVSSSPPTMQCEVKKILRLEVTFENVLSFLEGRRLSLTEELPAKLSKENQARFATWARGHLRSLLDVRYIKKGKKCVTTVRRQGIAQKLPIWEVHHNSESVFVAATDPALRMLPRGMSLAIAEPYLEPHFKLTEYDDRLPTVLGVKELSLQAFIQILRFPPTLVDVRSFRSLLDKVLLVVASTNQGLDVTGIRVPNTSGVMVPANTLYAHSVNMFRAAFGENSDRFLHPSLRADENRLSAFGICNSVTFSAFKECAREVDRNAGTPDANLEGAIAIFEFYNSNLWRDPRATVNGWRELDNLKFIPRQDLRRSYYGGTPSFSPNDWAVELPQIVSPNQIIRPAQEAVAWTQRARARDAPSDRLLVANLDFGVPTLEEVLHHLQRLVVIAELHRRDEHLANDFKAIYAWFLNRLSTDPEGTQALLLGHQKERLWLNVDNPQISWEFVSADSILFNGWDEGNRRYPRQFLLGFKELLLAIGAKEIKRAIRPQLQMTPAEQTLNKLRKAFDKQRRERQFTDVELLSSDGEGFHAHRSVLAATTDHFMSMFGSGWKESNEPIHTEERAEVLRHVLDFVYLGAIEEVEDRDTLLELLELSDRWDLTELFECVENQLTDKVSPDSYEHLLEMSDRYNAKNLRKACIGFKKDNEYAL